MYRNARQALLGEAKYLLEHGVSRPSRNGNTLEVCGREIAIERPYENFLLLAERNDNPVAKIAETLWVLGGRNDLHYLSHYLPRARDFSDDGHIWRGAYGPRLRHWYRYGISSVDQIAECVKLLRADPTSRRAVMTIYDPAVDFCESKDIPCNNWIQWLIRDDKLHMYVTIRSNDLMWGFSGINAFEWSILHQFMANWLDVAVGEYHQYVGSLHLYEHHFERVQRMLDAHNGYEPYNNPVMAYPDPSSTFELFDAILNRWYFIELQSRAGSDKEHFADCLELAMHMPDLFMREAAYMIVAANALPHSIASTRVALSLMPPSAMSVSAWDYCLRNSKPFAEAYGDHKPDELVRIQQPRLPDTGLSFSDVCAVLKVLEYKKTLRYGQSWRKHGEVLSIFANISRKWDRLDNMHRNGVAGTSDESEIDTLGDLAVYCLKYAGFLGEVYLQDDLPRTFEAALDRVEFYQGLITWGYMGQLYTDLERVLTSSAAYEYNVVKYDRTMQLAQACIKWIEQLSTMRDHAAEVSRWVASVEAL